MHRAVVLVLALALAACSSDRAEDRLMACPQLSLPADVADLTRHRAGTPPDPGTLVLDARIAAVEGRCAPARRGEAVSASIALRFDAERGPAATGRGAELPWFVAVIEGGTDRVLSRQAFRTPIEFPANTTRTGATSRPVEVLIPVAEGRPVQEQRIMVGFLLSEEEVALNRRRGPR